MTDPRGSVPDGERVYLVGYYGVDNLGDEAIRAAIERAAARLGVDIVRYASRTADPDPRAVQTGLRTIPGQVSAIRAADRVVLGGGGILKDEGLRLPAELLVTALLARAMGRRVTLLGVGVGPFYHRIGRWLVAAVARLAHVRTVRDAASRDALRSLGVGRVLVGADPIFSTDSEPDGRPAAGSAAPHVAPPGEGNDPADRRALVSLRSWFHKLPAEERAARQVALRAAIVAGLDPLVAAGWRMDLVALYWPRDRDVADELMAAMGAPGRAASLAPDGSLTWDALVGRAGGVDLVVAMRYHAVAAAALAGTPTVAIAYEPKVQALAESLGIPWVAVDDPDLGTRLADLTGGATRGGSFAVPDPDAVGRLRQDAWSVLRAALLG